MSHIQVKEREYPQEIYDVAWSFIEREYESLKYLCVRYSRGQQDLVDDLMADVITLRMPGVVATYKLGASATLRTHVFANMKWYLMKQMDARDKHHVRFGATLVSGESGQENHGEDSTIVDVAAASDEVQYILSLLTPYDRSLISLYHLCHVGFEELGDILGVSYGTARKHYRQALARAKESVGQDTWMRLVKEIVEDVQECSTLSVPSA